MKPLGIVAAIVVVIVLILVLPGALDELGWKLATIRGDSRTLELLTLRHAEKLVRQEQERQTLVLVAGLGVIALIGTTAIVKMIDRMGKMSGIAQLLFILILAAALLLALRWPVPSP
jgi:hypothetical protein